MNDKIRAIQESMVSSRYTVVKGSRCAYCGEVANARDHVYPVSAMYKLMGQENVQDGYRGFRSFIVPTCNECNSLGGALIFSTFEEKRAHIRKRLRGRYAHELSFNWTIEDLFFETEDGVFEKIGLMKRKSLVENRLYHRHCYNLTHPVIEAKPGKTAYKYVFLAKDKTYSIHLPAKKGLAQSAIAKDIPTIEEAVKIRDEMLISRPDLSK